MPRISDFDPVEELQPGDYVPFIRDGVDYRYDLGSNAHPSVIPTLAALKALDTDLAVAFYSGATWFWVLGNYTGLEDDDYVVESDDFPISTGAWVNETYPLLAAIPAAVDDATASLDTRVTANETEIAALQGTVTSGRRQYATYASAVSDAATPVLYPAVTLGTVAEVPTTDAGTHTDPVFGGTVNNTGIFRWSVSPAGWGRISDTSAASAAPYAAAAAASAATATAAAAQVGSIPNYGRNRHGNFYDPLYGGFPTTITPTDDGRWSPITTGANRWSYKASDVLAPGGLISAYVRSTSGTYGGTPSNITFLNAGSGIISTTNFGATDANGAKAIDALTIPALTVTIQIDYYPASISDIYEMQVAAGSSTMHLRYVNANHQPIIEEQAIPGVRREVRGFGNAAMLVNVPTGDVHVYNRIVKARGGSVSVGELTALHLLVEGMRLSGLMDKCAWMHPLCGTGLGALDTPLLDRYGMGKVQRPVAFTTWDPTLGLVSTYPTAGDIFDTTIIPSEHGFNRAGYGFAVFILSARTNDIASAPLGSNIAPTTIPNGAASGIFPLYAGSQFSTFSPTDNTGQVIGNAQYANKSVVGSGAGLVTTPLTVGSHIASRRGDSTGLISFNGFYSGEVTTPITIDAIPDESVKISNYGDTLGFLALFNQPLELSEHAIMARLMNNFNKAVRATPPVIEGGF